jgi:segregation and condensation protein A
MDLKQEERSFVLDDFEGPLDLLLYMIRKNEINIYDIPISQITEQYIEYLRNAETVDIEDMTAFHEMASTLLYIKSRTLLPVEMDDEEEDPRADLVERLIEYQKIKKLSGLMEEKEKENEWVLERRRLQHDLPFTDEDMWKEADIWDLVKIFSTFTRNLPAEQIINLYEEVSVNEKTTLLSEFLENSGECKFTNLIVRPGAMDIVCAFLAVLEAAKLRLIVLFQNRMFGDILIKQNSSKV